MKMKLFAITGTIFALTFVGCQNPQFKRDMPRQLDSPEEITNLGTERLPITIWKTMKRDKYEVIIAVQESPKAFHENESRQSLFIYAKTEGHPYKLISSINGPEAPFLKLEDAFWPSNGIPQLIISANESWSLHENDYFEWTGFGISIELNYFDLTSPESGDAIKESFSKKIKSHDSLPLVASLEGKSAHFAREANGTLSVSFPPYKRTFYNLKDKDYAAAFRFNPSHISLSDGKGDAITEYYYFYTYAENRTLRDLQKQMQSKE